VAAYALTNCTILTGQADISGASNAVELDTEVAELDATTFSSSGYAVIAPGLHSVSSKVSGLWDAGSAAIVDDALWAQIGAASAVQTVSPGAAAVGDVAFFTKLIRPKYAITGQVGELLKFESSGIGDGTPLVRGKVANNSARTATGTTAAVLLTAPTETQRVYCAIHAVSVSGGGSLVATLQSDDGSGFPSPTTVATSSAITAAGSQLLTGALGATALEPYYRLSFVVTGGSSPSWLIVASIGVA
jgi:hypothetical protein